MKLGYINHMSGATVTSTGNLPLRIPENVADSTITFWESATDDDTLTIDLGSSLAIDLLTLHRVIYDGTITVTIGSYVKVLTDDDYSGIEVLSLGMVPGVTNQNISITFTGGTAPPIVGYVFAGTALDFTIKSEARQDFDDAGDVITITESGYVGASKRSLLRSYQMTLNQDSTPNLKTKMRKLFKQGYAEPRPAYISFPNSVLPEETALVIFDAPRLGYDILSTKEDGTVYSADITIGLSEVLGSV